jgi:radical SAM protein with 4Fe4S-binding SPASM domain
MDLSEQVELPLPGSAHIEPVGPAKAPALLSVEAFRALLDQQPGLKALELQGAGEPLAHPRLFDMIANAVSRGIDVTTRTRLLTLSDERIEECIASGLRRIDVAPGAVHPSDCDYLRPGSKLRRALANVRRLAAARSNAFPEIRVVLMLLKSNRERLPELIRLARAHGADAIALEHLWHDQCPARRFVEAESLLKEKPALDDARALAVQLGIRLDMPRARRCERPWRRIHIGAWGEALPCPQARTAQRRTLGNARRDGIVSVWNNDAYRTFRERLASDTPPELCRNCSLYESRPTGS